MKFFQIIILFFAFFQITNLVAQQTETTFDKNLLVKYSESELLELKNNAPQQLEFLNYCTFNAYKIGIVPKKKMTENNGRIKEIQLDDFNSVNFHSLNIDLIQDDYQYFHIIGTDKLLIVKSINHIKEELKK